MSSKPVMAVAGLNPDDVPACLTSGFDPDIWYATDEEIARDARAVCARCKVSGKCLAGAIARGERFGIHGGFNLADEYERKRAAKEVTLPAPEPLAATVMRTARDVTCTHCGLMFQTRRSGAAKCPQCVRGLVGIEPTRTRVRELRAAGWTSERIAAASGVAPSSVRGIDYKARREWVSGDTERRILAIPAPAVAS